ncbi:hypothetical protein [Altericista sp. CCNU0014]|uniref:hypothetical protein n=1 Tax=Altericista sp. CCNU0014 TaxID=3082949 RepID=UPI0038500B65
MKVNQLLQKASSSVGQLRQDPSVRLTLYLLFGVVMLGVLSALAGYLFGHESLKGVTQPNMNPFTASAQGQYPREGSYLLKESDILAKVERETKGISKASEPKKPEQAKKEAKASPSPSPDKNQQTSLPISVQSEGMRLEVRALTVAGDEITLDVGMRNEGTKEVQFLYDFLDLSDDQSQVLSSEVKGLPTKFPPKSETYSGVIKVSGVPQNSIKWFSLGLADYPDQKVELKIPKIFIEKK